MPVISPRRSSATSSSFYVSPSSSSTTTDLSGRSSYLDRGNTLSKASSTSYNSSYGYLGNSSYSSYLPPRASTNTSTYRSSIGTSSSSSSSLTTPSSSYTSGGISKFSSYRSPSTYYNSNNDSTLSSRYGLKTKSKLLNDGNHDTSKTSNSSSITDNSSKSNNNRLSSSYSSSSLARLVATSGLDIYEKYSPAHYIPKCEISRSRSSVSETTVSAVDGGSSGGSNNKNSIQDEYKETSTHSVRPTSRYSRFISKNSNEDGKDESTAVAGVRNRSSNRASDKLVNSSSSSSLKKSSSYSNTNNVNTSSTKSDRNDISPIPTYTIRNSRLRKSNAAAAALTNNADDDGENVLKNGSVEVISNSYRNSYNNNSTDSIATTRNHFKDLKLSSSSSSLSGVKDCKEIIATEFDTPTATATITITKCSNGFELNSNSSSGDVSCSNSNTATLSKLDNQVPSNNSKQLPPLKQKCDVVNGTVKHQQHQSIKLQGKYNDLLKTTTKSTTAAAATTSTSATNNFSGNTIRSHHNRSSSDQQHILNIKNKAAGFNPVSAANQHFFLIQAYKDQNFLKKECELARSQVVRLEAKERLKSISTHSKELSSSRCLRFEKANGKEASTTYNEDSYNNNNNNSRHHSSNNNVNTSATGRKTETKPLQTATNGRRFSNSNSTGLSSAANVIASGGFGNSNALPKINKLNCCNPPATQTLAGQQQRGGAFVRPSITTISLARPAATTNNSNKFLKQAAAKTDTANKYNFNNNNMQKQQSHPQQQCVELNGDEDIKYIDSDEPVVTYEQQQSGNSMNCQQRCCTEQQQQQQKKHAVTGKIKVRPKSTIICSTNLQQQHNKIFEKVNSYRYGGGSGSSHNTATDLSPQLSVTANAALAERRRELKKTIDSNSIKASIEKFNSLSEQKRLPHAASNSNNPTAKNALRHHHHHHLNHNIAAGHSGSTSNINIQHHRYSSDFSDTVRLPSSVIGGGSLTRTATRNLNTTASIVNKVVTNLYTGASASTSPVTIKATRNLNTLSNQSSESSSPTHVSSSSSSPAQKTTTLLQLRSGAVSERLKDNNNSNVATVAGTTANKSTKTCPNPQVTSSTAAAASIESNDNKLSNNLCDIDDSARSSSSLRSALPPPSPTASRYWDRESNRTSSSTRNEDHINSKPLDEKSEGLCGLRNIGNTCFMNSVIQCLSHTSELTKFLKTQNGVRSSPSSRDQQILYEFAKLIREMWTASVHSVTPMELKRAFSTKHRMYSDYNQQDAQEFLRFFLDSLHCALNTGVKGGEALKIDDNLSDNKKADLTWEWYSRHENSLIRDLFVGQLKSALKCTTCGNTSVTFDPFWDLSVSLPSSSRCKLDACLDLFIREEVLDGDEMPTCSKCQTRRKCTKSFTIQRFPKYLVIHLKRFSETRWSKLSNIVEFPTGERELNMGPYGANHSTNVHYSLYAISNHMGSTAGGHYVALCKHPVSKKWHEFNDNIVSDDLSENHLVSSSAYILFYERA